jgi:hypothetical protein
VFFLWFGFALLRFARTDSGRLLTSVFTVTFDVLMQMITTVISFTPIGGLNICGSLMCACVCFHRIFLCFIPPALFMIVHNAWVWASGSWQWSVASESWS